ncbi:MAG TPA: hypothetical protein VFX60_15050 [Micromonospora sp.]|nr:hypothetical protein [Micromonospora sp.]
MAQQNLNKMKTGEVAQRARKAGIKGIENMNKEQLIQAMGGEAPAAKKPGRGGGHRPAPPGSKPQDWKSIPGNQS